ncbi:hypothetical protein EZS27_001749 [termite gut metagenome]|uniref:DUF1828 domain-containing protein n=1 Tax=termite gut metagenome TaxID=433724 RepID=A0A5J4SYU4_9ZZZZ
MNIWIDKLIDDYYSFLKGRTEIITDTGTEWTVISTPFVSAFNDTLNIYIKKSNGKIILSDDGDTLKNLDLQGVSITHSAKRKDILDNTLLTYGIISVNDEFTIEATESNFAQKKHNFIMAISEINDMYMLSKQSISSIFKDDVRDFLDEQEITYTPQFISKGQTGLEFTFDFQIAYRTKEIVIKSFNSLNKINIPNFLFTWDDIKPIRQQVSHKTIVGVALINDTDREVSTEYLDALKSKDANYILWSERYKPENRNKLTA